MVVDLLKTKSKKYTPAEKKSIYTKQTFYAEKKTY